MSLLPGHGSSNRSSILIAATAAVIGIAAGVAVDQLWSRRSRKPALSASPPSSRLPSTPSQQAHNQHHHHHHHHHHNDHVHHSHSHSLEHVGPFLYPGLLHSCMLTHIIIITFMWPVVEIETSLKYSAGSCSSVNINSKPVISVGQ
jgi:hypothetical protein